MKAFIATVNWTLDSEIGVDGGRLVTEESLYGGSKGCFTKRRSVKSNAFHVMFVDDEGRCPSKASFAKPRQHTMQICMRLIGQ